MPYTQTPLEYWEYVNRGEISSSVTYYPKIGDVLDYSGVDINHLSDFIVNSQRLPIEISLRPRLVNVLQRTSTRISQLFESGFFTTNDDENEILIVKTHDSLLKALGVTHSDIVYEFNRKNLSKVGISYFDSALPKGKNVFLVQPNFLSSITIENMYARYGKADGKEIGKKDKSGERIAISKDEIVGKVILRRFHMFLTEEFNFEEQPQVPRVAPEYLITAFIRTLAPDKIAV